MAEVDEAGLVKILDVPGNVAVMVRYQGLVSVYSVSIPLGAPVENCRRRRIHRHASFLPISSRSASPLAALR